MSSARSFGLPKSTSFVSGIVSAGLGRVAAVVDHGEHVEAERFDPGDGAPQDLVDAPVASQGDHAVRIVGCHASTVRGPGCCSNPPAA